MYEALLNRRYGEKHIGYLESHDQALVGDKTLAHQLMDAEIYSNMHRGSGSMVVDRGVALHKMLRLIVFALAGEGYMNFMGNEFGHPEWIDFPREGNGQSYHYARRQWSLADNLDLRYHGLNEFDKSMQALDKRFNLLSDPFIEQLMLHEDTQQVVFRRGPLVFVFNFNPTDSFANLRIPVPDARSYAVILNSDELAYGGHGRVAEGMTYQMQTTPLYGRQQSIQIYLPCRSVQVLAPILTV